MDHSTVLLDERQGAPVIGDELSCMACMYSLRGIACDGVCPECGTTVEFSRRAGPLALGDRAYVRALWLGSGRIVYAMCFAVGMVVMAFLMPVLVTVGGGVMLLPLLVLWLLAAVFGVWGWWRFTTRDHAKPPGAKGGVARVVTRIALGLYLLLTAMGFAGALIPGAGGVAGFSALGWLVFVIGVCAGLRYTRTVAARIPDRLSMRRARAALLLFLGVVVFSIVGVAAFIMMLIHGFAGGAPMLPEPVLVAGLFVGLGVSALCTLSGMVVFFMLFLRLRRLLRGVLEQTGGLMIEDMGAGAFALATSDQLPADR